MPIRFLIWGGGILGFWVRWGGSANSIFLGAGIFLNTGHSEAVRRNMCQGCVQMKR